jgi:hypothetical protein
MPITREQFKVLLQKYPTLNHLNPDEALLDILLVANSLGRHIDPEKIDLILTDHAKTLASQTTKSPV